MERLKRTISMLLCTAMLLSGIPGVSFASEEAEPAFTEPVGFFEETAPDFTEPAVPAEEPCGEDLAEAVSLPASGSCGESATWTLDENGLLTISGSGTVESGYSNGGEYLPNYKECVTSLVLSNGITGIGYEAFYNFRNLTEVSLPNSLATIGGLAFCKCVSLTDVVIPDSVTTIEKSAFNQCSSLRTVKLSSGMTDIPEMMFYYCESLTEIAIPSGITSIGAGAFYQCGSLQTVSFPAELTETSRLLQLFEPDKGCPSRRNHCRFGICL